MVTALKVCVVSDPWYLLLIITFIGHTQMPTRSPNTWALTFLP